MFEQKNSKVGWYLLIQFSLLFWFAVHDFWMQQQIKNGAELQLQFANLLHDEIELRNGQIDHLTKVDKNLAEIILVLSTKQKI